MQIIYFLLFYSPRSHGLKESGIIISISLQYPSVSVILSKKIQSSHFSIFIFIYVLVFPILFAFAHTSRASRLHMQGNLQDAVTSLGL